MERPNFGGNLEIGTHQVLEDRIEAAKILLETHDDDDITILVDTMANHASKAYAATPERLYCILDGEIVLEGKTGPFGYNLDQVESFLESVCNKN